MTFFTSKVISLFRIFSLVILFLLSVSVLPGQKPITPNVKATLPFCGSLHARTKPGPIKPVIRTVRDEDEVYSDRFGNYYSADDLVMPKDSYSNDPSIKLITGYFNPRFDTEVPQNVRAVINQVLTDLVPIIEQQNPVNECTGEPNRLNIRIFWGDFAMPADPVWNGSGLDEEDFPEQDSGVLGIGTPIYLQDFSPGCNGTAIDRPFMKLNGGPLRNTNQFTTDAIMILNSNVDAYSEIAYPNQTISYNFDAAANSTSATEIDLYTIVLHEMMHILGFASRVAANLNEYSRWDLEILNLDNSTNLLSPVSETPYCYELPDDFETLINNNWAGGPFLGFNGTDELVVSSNNFELENISNDFSHLANYNGINIDYVMLPSISAAEEKRVLSDEEVDILCEMGYQTNTPNCNACYTLGFAESGNGFPCQIQHTLCSGVSQDFILQDLLRIVNSGMEINWLEPFATFNGDPIDDLTQLDINDGVLTVSTDIETNGLLTVFFPLSACDENRTELLRFNFMVDKNCGFCEQQESITCENVSCYTDFNHLTDDDLTVFFGPAVRTIGGNNVSSADNDSYEEGNGTLNSFVGIAGPNNNREPITLPLLSPLGSGCTATISFDVGLRSLGNVHIWGSEAPICPFSSSDPVIPFSCDGPISSCSDGTFFRPYCLGVIDDLEANVQGIPNSAEPFELRSIVFENNTGETINFVHVMLSAGYGYFDNFEVTIQCPVEVNIDEDIPNSFCNGTSEMITFQLCNNGFETTDIDVDISSQPGWTITGSNAEIDLTSGDCSTISYNVSPDQGTVDGSYPFELTISGTNQCGITEEINFPFTLTTEQCIQQFDCDVPGADLVGQTNCNRRISDMASNLPTPFCPEPDVAVFWPVNGLSNATIIVEEELIIDQNYTFTNCEIIMLPNARITVNNGRTLRINGSSPQQSWIHGCTALWAGIHANGTGRIFVNNTRIQDATEALDLRNGAFLRLTNSELVNNSTGVFIQGNKTGPNVTVQQFWGNFFAREGQLMPYSGTAPFTPASVGVNTNENYIANTFGVTPTAPPLSNEWLSQRNLYRDLETGIVSVGGEVIAVLHSLFENNAPVAENTGISLVKSNLTLTGEGQDIVSFSNLDFGVRGTDHHYINATENLFRSCNIGIGSEDNGRVEINDNTFDGVGDKAISYNNSDILFVNPMSISGNRIDLDAPQFTYGIDAVNHRQGSGFTEIVNNTITLRGPGVGIRLGGNSVWISENTITTTELNPPTTGIEFRYGKRISASLNSIIGPGANSSTAGIVVGTEDEANPYLKCNLFNDLADGLVVLSTGVGLRIVYNEFAGDMRAGIYFGPNHTSFLRHPNGRNQWTGNFVVGALVSDLPASTPNPATILDNQRWTVASNLFPPSVTLLNLPAALEDVWVVEGPATNFTPCAPATDGFTTKPDVNAGKSLSSAPSNSFTKATTSLVISPNPSTVSTITVRVPELNEAASLSLMDIYGRTIEQRELSAGPSLARELQLELPQKGIYFVVMQEGGIGSKPIIKKVIRN